MTGLGRDRRGATALEFALCFPVVLLFVFSLFAVVSLISSWRAMDVGVERALRYAAVHGSGGTDAVVSAYKTAAGVIWRDVGTGSSVSVTFPTATTVRVSATYAWAAAASTYGTPTSTIFGGFTLSAAGQMRIVN